MPPTLRIRKRRKQEEKEKEKEKDERDLRALFLFPRVLRDLIVAYAVELVRQGGKVRWKASHGKAHLAVTKDFVLSSDHNWTRVLRRDTGAEENVVQFTLSQPHWWTAFHGDLASNVVYFVRPSYGIEWYELPGFDFVRRLPHLAITDALGIYNRRICWTTEDQVFWLVEQGKRLVPHLWPPNTRYPNKNFRCTWALEKNARVDENDENDETSLELVEKTGTQEVFWTGHKFLVWQTVSTVPGMKHFKNEWIVYDTSSSERIVFTVDRGKLNPSAPSRTQSLRRPPLLWQRRTLYFLPSESSHLLRLEQEKGELEELTEDQAHHTLPILHFVLAENAGAIVSLALDRTICVRDASTGVLMQTLTTHLSPSQRFHLVRDERERIELLIEGKRSIAYLF